MEPGSMGITPGPSTGPPYEACPTNVTNHITELEAPALGITVASTDQTAPSSTSTLMSISPPNANHEPVNEPNIATKEDSSQQQPTAQASPSLPSVPPTPPGIVATEVREKLSPEGAESHASAKTGDVISFTITQVSAPAPQDTQPVQEEPDTLNDAPPGRDEEKGAPVVAEQVKEEAGPNQQAELMVDVPPQEVQFEKREFDSLENVEAAIKVPPPLEGEEAVTSSSQAEAGKKRRGHSMGSRTSMPRHSSKRSRSSTTGSFSTRDDDDTEMSEGATQQRPPPKKRARLSESARASVSATPASEISLEDLPAGWTAPLLFFATMTKKQSWKLWKALPERRVCNGAVWLSPTCTGTPGLSDHVDGPTAILRDLVSLLQNPSDAIKLHENNYTSLARANVRSSVPASKISTEFGVTRVIKALTEREYIQRLPIDLICALLVQQLRSMLNRCKRFPSHLFASELHLFQCAPTVAFHLQANELPFSLAGLLAAFGDATTQTSIEALREEYKKNVGTRSIGSRRRGEGATSATASFFMTNETEANLTTVLDTVQSRLDAIRAIPFGPKLPAENFIKGTAYGEGDFVVKELPVRLLPRSAAALRDRTYDFYDIPSFIICADLTQVVEEDKTAFNQAITMHTKEDAHWLDSITAQYIDLTLTEEEEAWLISKERWESQKSVPPPSPNPQGTPRSIVQNLISHTSSVAPNAKIVISLNTTPAEEKGDKTQARTKAFVSIQCTKDIGEDEQITLNTSDKKVTWAELADDDTTSEGTEE